MIGFRNKITSCAPDPEIVQIRTNTILATQPEGLHDEYQYIEHADLGYTGHVRDLKEELVAPVSHAHAILTASRLLRASIDEKIRSKGKTLDFDEIGVMSGLFLTLLTSQGNMRRGVFANNSSFGLLRDNRTVKQQHDSTTRDAMAIDKIDKATETLHNITADDERILLLTLCHGGLISGGAVYALDQQQNPRPGSFFYPIRFSRAKHRDKAPRLTDKEKRAIERYARDRQVVIFDEDISTGRTMKNAQENIQEIAGKTALVLTTLDARKNFAHFDSTD